MQITQFRLTGGKVAEVETQMSGPDREQISNIEQGLERAEQEFRRAVEAKDFAGLMQAHNRMCQLVAALTAAWTGGPPTVFSRFYVPNRQTGSIGGGTGQHKIVQPGDGAGSGTGQHKIVQPAAPATSPEEKVPAEKPAEKPVEAAKPADDDVPEISVLEKQLAELASRMQKCLEAGDMDGMLQANEKMGQLSEMMAKAEARQKDRSTATASVLLKLDEAAEASPNKLLDKPNAPKALAGGWSAGDTLAFAKARAEERKKQQKLADSFESVVGQVETPGANATGAPAAGSQPSSTVDMLFSDRSTKAEPSSGGVAPPPAPAPKPKPKRQLTADELREKLEQYTFYEILAIPSTASFEELHKSFLRKIRKLNKKLANKTMDEWQFQELVAALCLAHDVLKFPNARLQYDLVLFGPADGSGPSAETAAKQKMMPLKEMLKFSTLIRIGELSEAIEKHKDSKDEREIGHYLVDKGLLSKEELDSIFFAQKLVSAGKLTVAQFELAMQEMRENSIPLLDTLVASEWIQPQDVFSTDFS